MSLNIASLSNVTTLKKCLELGNNELLIECVETLGFDQLIKGDLIETARSVGFSLVVIFLATLAIENNCKTERNATLLYAYQSILAKKLNPELKQLGMRKLITLTTKAIIKNSYRLDTLSASTCDEWRDSITLAID